MEFIKSVLEFGGGFSAISASKWIVKEAVERLEDKNTESIRVKVGMKKGLIEVHQVMKVSMSKAKVKKTKSDKWKEAYNFGLLCSTLLYDNQEGEDYSDDGGHGDAISSLEKWWV